MNKRNLKKVAATATISGGLGLTALGLSSGVANADDGNGPWVPRVPWQPGEILHKRVPWGPGPSWWYENNQGEDEQN